jgi:hypothetical protein
MVFRGIPTCLDQSGYRYLLTVLSIHSRIFAGNRSGLVGIVESLRRGEPLVELTGARPLVLTIEMGIEKLRRDYSHALLATGIYSYISEAPFFLVFYFQSQPFSSRSSSRFFALRFTLLWVVMP